MDHSDEEKTSNDRDSSRYESIDELGRGGWGVVQRAIDHQLDRVVAVKRIGGSGKVTREARERFLHEAKITSQLQHPGVVPVHELGGDERGGEAFYVMKLLEGDTLRHEIRAVHKALKDGNAKPSSIEFHDAILSLLHRFVDVCNAVGYAHQQGVIHRDLKPANIMTGHFGETIVVDWGLAKHVSEDSEEQDAHARSVEATLAAGEPVRDVDDIEKELDRASSLANRSGSTSGSKSRSRGELTSHGSIIGTPAYMSPEQARASKTASQPSSDLFSLGVILFEILVGQHPHTGLDVDTVLERVRGSRWKTPQQTHAWIPRPLSAICIKAMDADPANRYGSAQEMAEEVRRYIAGDAVAADTETLLDRVHRWCRRHRTLATTAAAVFMVGLIAAVTIAVVIRGAHAIERAARQDAQTAHEAAVGRLTQTREAADTWLIDLSGALQFYPGLDPIRQKLINDAISHYETLLPATEAEPLKHHLDADDPLWQQQLQLHQKRVLERVQCNIRLGDLHRLSSNKANATKYYDQAAVDAKRLLIAHRNSGAIPMMEHHIHCEQVNAMVGKYLISDGNQMLELEQKQAAKLQKKMEHWLIAHEAGGLSDDNDALWCKTASCLSRLAFVTQQHDISADWARNLFKHRGSDGDARWVQTVAMRRAKALEAVGKHVASCEVWQDLVNHLLALCSDHPDRVDYRQSLAAARLQLADSLNRSGEGLGISSIYSHAIEDLNQSIALANKDEFCIANMAKAELGLGRALMESPETAVQAQQHLRRSIALLGQMLKTELSENTMREFIEAHRVLINMHPAMPEQELLPLIKTAKTALTLLIDHELSQVGDRLELAELILRQLECCKTPDAKQSCFQGLVQCLNAIHIDELDQTQLIRLDELRRQSKPYEQDTESE